MSTPTAEPTSHLDRANPMTVVLRRGILLTLALTLLLAGCNDQARPDTASWLPMWEALVAVVPDQSELGDPPDDALCEETLVAVRSENENLFPSPSVSVDDLVTEWVGVVEAAFFDCPPGGEVIASFQDAYKEIDRIQESVETALSDQT